MKTLYFRCRLLTDVVLNQRAATEGNQKTLDFIPGNNFLGIVAAQIYSDVETAHAPSQIVHSGKVRFGDAHPELDNKRTLKIPASFYKGKLKTMKDGLYVSHAVTNPDDSEYKDFQPKQCREGFYVFDSIIETGRAKSDVELSFTDVKVAKSFAIKSAYDRDKRRSKDEQMYGYESLEAGSTFLFEVEIDDSLMVNGEALDVVITNALVGKRHIGRSRTAQYGLVEIEPLHDYLPANHSNPSNPSNLSNHSNPSNPNNPNNQPSPVLVYADARLIFLDEYGLPTFQPSAQDLGFENGEIDWTKSQIRTFQYAPYNYKRQCRDADRCGIEKGSVFVVKGCTAPVIANEVKQSHEQEIASSLAMTEKYVGAYQNEGFGKVIYNPDFLAVTDKSNGKALYKYKDSTAKDTKNTETRTKISDEALRALCAPLSDSCGKNLIQFLVKQHNNDITEQDILKKVNEFVSKNGSKFSQESFASQWGAIRSLAMQHADKRALRDALFKESVGYLVHGIAQEKWDEKGRLETFKSFVDSVLQACSDREFQSAIINLSAEMAKICKKGGKR